MCVTVSRTVRAKFARISSVPLPVLLLLLLFLFPIELDARLLTDRHPLLLIPGIGGSILRARHRKTGAESDVWVRTTFADKYFLRFLSGNYDPVSGIYKSHVDDEYEIYPPQDDHGLFAIDTLAPDLPIQLKTLEYFHAFVVDLQELGFVPGRTLFGFPYDWRQSAAATHVLDALEQKIETAFAASGGLRVNLVSHSYGCLVTRSYLTMRSAHASKHIRSWVAIGGPFDGASVQSVMSMLTGYAFENPLLTLRSAQTVAVCVPGVYTLLPNPLRGADSSLFRLTYFSSHEDRWVQLDQRNLSTLFTSAFEGFSYIDGNGNAIPASFSAALYEHVMHVRTVWETVPLPRNILYFNMYGDGVATATSATFETKISDVKQLVSYHPFIKADRSYEAKFVVSHSPGDGTVSTLSAGRDIYDGAAVVQAPIMGCDHIGLMSDIRVKSIVKGAIGVGCRWDGVWDAKRHGLMYVRQDGWSVHMVKRSVVELHATAHSKTTVGAEKKKETSDDVADETSYEHEDPEDPDDPAEDEDGRPLWRELASIIGQLEYGGHRLVGTMPKARGTFVMTIGTDCNSIRGQWTHDFPASGQPFLFEATKVPADVGHFLLHDTYFDLFSRSDMQDISRWSTSVASRFQCDSDDPDGELLMQRCVVDHGLGTRPCIDSLRTPSCIVDSCDPGFTLFADRVMGSACVSCAVGWHKDFAGVGPCSPCRALEGEGATYVAADEQCTVGCIAGFGKAPAPVQTNSSFNASEIYQQHCEQCPAGTYQPHLSSDAQCVACTNNPFGADVLQNDTHIIHFTRSGWTSAECPYVLIEKAVRVVEKIVVVEKRSSRLEASPSWLLMPALMVLFVIAVWRFRYPFRKTAVPKKNDDPV